LHHFVDSQLWLLRGVACLEAGCDAAGVVGVLAPWLALSLLDGLAELGVLARRPRPSEAPAKSDRTSARGVRSGDMTLCRRGDLAPPESRLPEEKAAGTALPDPVRLVERLGGPSRWAEEEEEELEALVSSSSVARRRSSTS
jgi:hypothetical protein